MRRERRAWFELPSRPPGKGRLLMLVVSMAVTSVLITTLVSAPRRDSVIRFWQGFAPTPNSPAPPSASVAPLPARRPLEFPAERVSRVRDNVLQLGDEDVWSAMWQRVQETPDQAIAEQSLGVVAYAQLQHQPNVYRGRIVGLEGTVRRVVTYGHAEGNAGTPSYSQLWLQPLWGPNEPIVICCADLPAGFPVGEAVQVAVRCHGFFYKRWAFAAQDGVRTAPVVLVRTVTAIEPQGPPPAHVVAAPRGPNVWIVSSLIVAVGTLAVAGAMWAFHGGRRRSVTRSDLRPDFQGLALAHRPQGTHPDTVEPADEEGP